MKLPRTGLSLAAIALLAACATPQPLPAIDLSAAQCAATADLGRAQGLSLTDPQGNPKTSDALTIDFNEQSPCLLEDGNARGLYAVVRLPQTAASYTIQVASAPMKEGSMAPLRLSVLDAGGHQTRAIDPDLFLFRGQKLTAQFRSHPGEALLLVMTDPAQIGQNLTRINTTVRVNYIPAGPVMVPVGSGADASQELRMGQRGEVTVSVKRDAAAS